MATAATTAAAHGSSDLHITIARHAVAAAAARVSEPSASLADGATRLWQPCTTAQLPPCGTESWWQPMIVRWLVAADEMRRGFVSVCKYSNVQAASDGTGH